MCECVEGRLLTLIAGVQRMCTSTMTRITIDTCKSCEYVN